MYEKYKMIGAYQLDTVTSQVFELKADMKFVSPEPKLGDESLWIGKRSTTPGKTKIAIKVYQQVLKPSRYETIRCSKRRTFLIKNLRKKKTTTHLTSSVEDFFNVVNSGA